MRVTSSLRPDASRRGFERAGDRIQRLAVRIVVAGRRLADDAAGPDEARDVVDVAIGVIVLQALVDPDDLAGAERFAERRFRLRLRPAVAVGIEQRLPRRQDGALAVMVDGAALQHEVEALHGRVGDARDVVADRRVVRQVVLAAPAIGGKAQRDRARCACAQKSAPCRAARCRRSAPARSRRRRRAPRAPMPPPPRR